MHNRLFDHLDLSQPRNVSEEKVARDDLAQSTRRILDEEQVPFTEEERARFPPLEIQHEVSASVPWSRSSRTRACPTSS